MNMITERIFFYESLVLLSERLHYSGYKRAIKEAEVLCMYI